MESLVYTSAMSSPSNAQSQNVNFAKMPFDQLIKAYEFAEQHQRFRKALEIGRVMVSRQPGKMHGHYAVGSALCNLGLLDEAQTALSKAITRDPKQAGIYTRLAEVLNRMGHGEDARDAVDTAADLAPKDPKVMVVKAMVYKLSGESDQAYAYLDQAIANGCTDPNVRSVHASFAGEMGKVEQGIADLEQLVDEADRKVWKDPFMHSAVLMHLSKLYDKVGRYDDAFACAKRAGDMRKTGYNPEKASEICDERIKAWTPERIANIQRSRVKGNNIIFILGMPRSGTSLIEQIIASHPLAYGGGELAEAYSSAIELSEPNEHLNDRSVILDQLKRASLDRCARKIVKAMEKAAGKNEDGKPYAKITDKLPSNYEFVGMLWAMLPDAKIIHCTRSPLDTCLSCYLLDFVGDVNHGYSYNLEHMAHQYRLYQRTMEHWKSVLPDAMLEVQYEDLVQHPIDGAKRIIDYVGLEWDDRCAQSHKTVRSVSTLSTDQVRKPMYTSSIGRWKHYEQHIAPLIDALGREE